MRRSHTTRITGGVKEITVEVDDRDRIWLVLGPNNRTLVPPEDAICIGMDLVNEGRLLRPKPEWGPNHPDYDEMGQ